MTSRGCVAGEPESRRGAIAKKGKAALAAKRAKGGL